MRVKEGATILLEAFSTSNIAGIGESMSGFIILTPTVGVHTYKLSLQRSSGTGTASSAALNTYPAFISAEDIGGV
jgi:hypothetical protein